MLTAVSVATWTLALDGGEIREMAKTFEVRVMLMGKGFATVIRNRNVFQGSCRGGDLTGHLCLFP